MSVKKIYEIEGEVQRRTPGKTDVKAFVSIREDGYASSLEIWHDKWYALPFHSLDEIADLVVALENLIEEAQGIDNGSLFNK